MGQLSNNIEEYRTPLILVAIASITALILMWQIIGRLQKKRDRELSEKYHSIYRVVFIPSDSQCILKADGASIEAGDYGWEAEPIYQNDLIYLHGLNDKWQVVWYAGFRPDQIEQAGPKPKSQYYVYPDWMINSNKVSNCPFPVKTFCHKKEYLKTHFGFPVEIHVNWVQGKRIAL